MPYMSLEDVSNLIIMKKIRSLLEQELKGVVPKEIKDLPEIYITAYERMDHTAKKIARVFLGIDTMDDLRRKDPDAADFAECIRDQA